MPLNRSFFDTIRDKIYNGHIPQSAVDTLNTIYDQSLFVHDVTLSQLAYIMATAFHEAGRTLVPVREYGLGHGRFYGDNPGACSNHTLNTNAPYNSLYYYGRGLVQLTWLDNYERMGKRLNVNLAVNPDMALDPALSVSVLLVGMLEGMFTKYKLSDFVNKTNVDFVNARKVVNNLDLAELIASEASVFLDGLKANDSQNATTSATASGTKVATASTPSIWQRLFGRIFGG